MKTLLQFLILFVLFLITALPQDGIDQTTFNNKMLKLGNSKLEMSLISQQREFFQEGFDSKDTRTTINKTLLGNGFLLIEIISQWWDGSAWVNNNKYSNTYDANNNLIERLWQTWNSSNWVNYEKHLYTYDGNNNKIEELGQNWYGSVWVNSSNILIHI